MRLGAEADQIHATGGEVIAISVDSIDRQIGMFNRWPLPHTLFVADPGGERYLRPLDVYDPEERDGIARPAMIVIGPDGDEVFRYVGRDFADRTTDESALAALAGLCLGSIEPPVGGPTGDVDPESCSGAFRPDWFVPWFKGDRAAAIAIGSRLGRDDPARAVARQQRLTSAASLEAWEQIRLGMAGPSSVPGARAD